MNVDRNTTRIVRSWLQEDTHENADRVLDAVLDLVETTPQKRTFGRAWRTPAMYQRLILGTAAAAIVIAAVGIALPNFRPATVGGPSPTTGPSAASSTPVASASASTMLLDDSFVGVSLLAGHYRAALGTTVPEVRFNMTLPAGWSVARSTKSSLGLTPPAGQPGPGVQFFTVLRVYKDPCHPEIGFAGSYLGHANAGDAERELRALRGFRATTATSTKVGAYNARTFVLSNSIDTATAKCTGELLLPLFATDDAPDKATEPTTRKFSESTNGGLTHRVWVVNVAEWPLLIVVDGDPTGEDLRVLNGILDSIRP
jgi:hypothetical protein